MNTALYLFLLACVVASVSMTIAKGSVFSSSRVWLMERVPFIGELVSCPYCTSHWVAFMVTAATSLRLTNTLPVVDFLIASMALVTLAAPLAWIIFQSYKQMA